MSNIFKLEDFGSPISEPVAPVHGAALAPDPTALASSHDTGYKAGWNDGAQSVQNEQTKMTADISVALQEAGFTYFEARQHVMNTMRPLIETMVAQLLPELAKRGLAERVANELLDIADRVDTPIVISCAEGYEEELSSIIAKSVSFPVEVQPEETLSSTQVILNYDDGRSLIDLDGAIETIKSCIAEFYSAAQGEEKTYG